MEVGWLLPAERPPSPRLAAVWDPVMPSRHTDRPRSLGHPCLPACLLRRYSCQPCRCSQGRVPPSSTRPLLWASLRWMPSTGHSWTGSSAWAAPAPSWWVHGCRVCTPAASAAGAAGVELLACRCAGQPSCAAGAAAGCVPSTQAASVPTDACPRAGLHTCRPAGSASLGSWWQGSMWPGSQPRCRLSPTLPRGFGSIARIPTRAGHLSLPPRRPRQAATRCPSSHGRPGWAPLAGPPTMVASAPAAPLCR
jgi:hypothetical protein